MACGAIHPYGTARSRRSRAKRISAPETFTLSSRTTRSHEALIGLKNIPEPLHSAYKRRAKAHSRSLQAEILQTLARGVAAPHETDALAVDDVAGMLKPQRKGVTIREMNEAIDRSLRESWK